MLRQTAAPLGPIRQFSNFRLASVSRDDDIFFWRTANPLHMKSNCRSISISTVKNFPLSIELFYSLHHFTTTIDLPD